MSELTLRVLIAIGISLMGVGIYLLVNRIILKRAARNTLGLEGFRPGRPAVLYFTMEGCVPCRTTQRPALALLSEKTGGKVQVIEVDVVAQAELANHWGVLSVPTTFIIDSEGQPRQVNHGVALAEKLLDQLERASGRSLTVMNISTAVEITAPDTGTD